MPEPERPARGLLDTSVGRVFAAVTAAGRKARGRRAVDLLVAAIALSADVPLYTRNAADFAGLAGIVNVMPVPAPGKTPG